MAVFSFAKKHRRLTLAFLVGLTFLLLYHRFLFGDAVLMYVDGGSDSFSSSYPIITQLARMLGHGDFSFYQLNYGLGGDFSSILLQYINPIKLLLLLAGGDRFPYAILLFLFVQYELVAFFAYDYFKRLLSNEDAALFSALLWTFVSYAVLWGQNYSFGTCLLLFTIVMDALQACLEQPGRRRFLLLVLALALSLISNYYFFYMTGVFLIFYLVFVTLFVKEDNENTVQRLKKTVSRLLRLAAAALASFLLAAAPLLTIIGTFFGSTRSRDIGGSFTSLFRPFEARALLSAFSRFFSTDLLKTGNQYTGAHNYYEVAVLFTSVLFLFAVIYLLQTKGLRLKTLFLTVLCLLALSLPLTGQLFNLSRGAQRYSFLIAFLEVIAIAFFMRALFTALNQRALLVSALASPVLAAAFLLFMWKGTGQLRLTVSGRAMLVCAIFFVLWSILFLFVAFRSDQRMFLLRFSALLLVIELAAANSASLYHRDYLTKADFSAGYYHDGTDEEVAHLKEIDRSLYRVSSDTAYNFANEGMVDDFYGTTAYSSTVTESLVNLSKESALSQLSSNFFIMGYEQYYLFTLLGGKYMIVDDDDYLAGDLETNAFFENSFSERAHTFVNKNTLPFAYLYEQQIAKEDYLSADAYLRQRLLTQAFYLTEESGTPGADSASSPAQAHASLADTAALAARLCTGDERSDLIERVFDANNMHFETGEDGSMTAVVDGADPYFVMDVAGAAENSDAKTQFLSIAFAPSSLSGQMMMELFVATQTRPTFGMCFDRLHYFSKEMPNYALLLPEAATTLRFDLPEGEGRRYEIKDFTLITSENAAGDFGTLKNSPVTDASFAKNRFCASVENQTTDSMLCIPLLYHKNWTAAINGETVPIENINGGLCGVKLPAGHCEVELHYAIPHFKLAAAISVLSLLVWLVLFVIPQRKSSRCHLRN